VRSADVDPATICFGIAQTSAIGDLGAARRLMTSLHDLGCRFALDDFGAGPGSLRQLKHLPFEVIKIDGEFVARLGSSRFDQLTVQAVVRVAEGSDRTTVAERVADERTLELLRAFGVDYAQGYHVARPQRARPGATARLVA
jgi:EAL domain-containing protein (putative c-di-GMP-specific phosphodiesterase class I)